MSNAGQSHIIWFLLTTAIIVFAYWHYKENKRLTREWNKFSDKKLAHGLTHFAWSRTIQFLLLLSCSTLIIIAYDSQLNKTRDLLLDAQKSKVSELQAAIKKPPESPVTALLPSDQSSKNSPPAANENKPNELEEIYNPEETTKGNQASMDSIKKRYEEILVTYFFLKKCAKINPSDYHIIISALSQEMASVNAPGRLQHDIVTAAQGSYQEMYAKSSCTDPEISTLYTQYSNYITSLSENFLAK